MTGTEYADILRDANMMSGGVPQYAWVRAWKTARGIPLGIAAEEAAAAAAQSGLLSLWLHECARSFCGRYTICAADFARAADEAAQAMRRSGAVWFPAAVHSAHNAQSFAAWSAAAYAGGLLSAASFADERVFLPWLGAMYARYQPPCYRSKRWN